MDAIKVQGNLDVVFKMVRAAFGRNVLGCTLSDMTCCTQASHNFDKALVFDGVIILLEDGHLIAPGSSTKIDMLCVKPFYELGHTINNISAISRSVVPRGDGKDTETCIVNTIVQMLDIYYETLCGREHQFYRFDVSLTTLLSAKCMTPALGNFDRVRLKNYGIIDGDILAAYFRAKYRAGYTIRITEPLFSPKWTQMFYTVLWYGGPRFCVVDGGICAFRTPDFPK